MPRKATVWIILRHFDKILVHAKYVNRSLYSHRTNWTTNIVLFNLRSKRKVRIGTDSDDGY